MQVAELFNAQNIFMGAGFSAIGLMVRGVLKKQDNHDKKLESLDKSVTELRVTAIGIDGANGMRGEIRELRRELRVSR